MKTDFGFDDTMILFTDLDGTLFDDDKKVSRKILRELGVLTDAGHRIVLATGRPLYSAKVVAEELGLYRDGVYLMASNGGVLFDCLKEEIISSHTLPMDVVKDVFSAAAEEGLHVQTYTDSHVVALRETEEIREYCKRIKMPYRILSAIPDELPAPPPKVIVICKKERSRGILEDFEHRHAQLVEGRAQSVFSSDILLEYIPLEVSKGIALVQLCNILDIPVGNSVAVGDEANDIPMLDAAGIAVVMKNGTQAAKSHADYITGRTNNEDGISEVLERYFI